MSWQRGAGFRIVGAVAKDPFCRERFGRLTLGVPREGGETRIDVVSFDPAMIDSWRTLGLGKTVQVTGKINMEAVKDKQKNKVKVDGYDKWVPLLVADKIDVQGAPSPPASGAQQPAPGSANDKSWD